MAETGDILGLRDFMPNGVMGGQAETSEPTLHRVLSAPKPGVVTKADVVAAIQTVYDPEIPVNLYDLGLIYRIDIDDAGYVDIDMTLTAPSCPVAGIMPGLVADAVETLAGVRSLSVQLVFDPPWTKQRMSEEARFALDMF